ncbi:GIY-YIG nuclease family protein [Pseudomonas sp. SA3-5]|uniref:GIY-YIG nuclease family protein n=1 Tax=Pseudomonas aestuarii TaxID=3018340 RepID=A0ABT4XE95_9PSED|nr:GIY-YIG nuclease family protein [Pseudomonas aestuarii]MDA7086531.1 GIY-YIG nuclease family protein [Pseudomonas aestuarii]
MTTYLYIIGAPGSESCVAKVGITESPYSRLNQIFTGCRRRKYLAPEGLELFALYRFDHRHDAQLIERTILLLNQAAKSDPRTLGWLMVSPLLLAPQILVLTSLLGIHAEKINCSFTRLDLEVLEVSTAV